MQGQMANVILVNLEGLGDHAVTFGLVGLQIQNIYFWVAGFG